MAPQVRCARLKGKGENTAKDQAVAPQKRLDCGRPIIDLADRGPAYGAKGREAASGPWADRSPVGQRCVACVDGAGRAQHRLAHGGRYRHRRPGGADASGAGAFRAGTRDIGGRAAPNAGAALAPAFHRDANIGVGPTSSSGGPTPASCAPFAVIRPRREGRWRPGKRRRGPAGEDGLRASQAWRLFSNELWDR
jgi:hypothetical protein